MRLLQTLLTLTGTVALLFALSMQTVAAEQKANKKRGQVYYQMVCTECHKDTAGRKISPSEFTMEQWAAYFDADAHDKSGKSNSKVTYYVSTEYRESIRDSNKAAKRFMKLGNEQLFADVRKFAVNGAKDSDTPATCN